MREMIKILKLISLLLLSACSAQYPAIQENPAAAFPYRHSEFDYKVAWKTSAANNVVIIDGILKNVRYPFIEGLDLTVFLEGADGRVRARATTLPFPQQSQKDEVVYFNAKLNNVAINPGDTFKFVIHYVGGEGGQDGRSDWRSNFAADAMTGAVRHKDNPKSEEW
jgi:hypothetical protein